MLRAYLLPARALRTLLATPANRDLVLQLMSEAPAPTRPPRALGPIFTRVPGASSLRADTPTRDDVDRLLAQRPVPPDRARATWRVVEAVAAGTAAATTRTTSGRPAGLAPLGLAVPAPDDLVVGSWTVTEAAALPSLSDWLEPALGQVPAGPEEPDVIVFWEAGSGG